MWKPAVPFRLSIDGKSLEAACWGPPPEEASTIVLLHEGLADPYGTRAQVEVLPEQL